MKGQMWPIKSDIKGRRILWGSPQNQISWAYMKELRENNRTKKIYPINPYVEVYQFRDNLYALFTQNCDGAGDVWMYLIVGPERALLIDTAYGLGDIKGLCDEISGGKPLIVANTHQHYDHAYGNCRFDEVYCHELLVGYLEKQDEHMWDYLFDDKGNCRWLEFDKNDLPKFKQYKVNGLPDGAEINIGGDYNVELVWTAGHAAGHAMYMDKKNRILFAGDDICSDVSGVAGGPRPGDALAAKYCNIKTYRDRIAALAGRLDEFDYIFPSHFMVNLENSLILNILETCDAILENPDGYDRLIEDVSPNGGVPMVRMHKYIKGFSMLAYNPKGVWPSEG